MITKRILGSRPRAEMIYMLHTEPKRLVAFDFLRGFFIFYVILLHPLLQRVFTQDAADFTNTVTAIPLWIAIIGIPFILIATWGSAFTLLTGAATAYQITVQMQRTPTDHILHHQHRSRMITSGLILLFHCFYVILFSNKSPDFPARSLITGYFESGSFTDFSGLMMLTGGTLVSIATAGAGISWIFRKIWAGGNYNPIRAIKIFTGITIVTFLITFINESIYVFPTAHAVALISQPAIGSKILGYLYMQCFTMRFSFFPLFGFAAGGAVIGILAGMRVRCRTLLKVGVIPAIIGLIIGAVYLISGFDILTHFASEHTPFMLQCVNFGLQMLTVTVALVFFDYETNRFSTSGLVMELRAMFDRYSSSSLTIFIMEPFVSILWYNGLTGGVAGALSSNLVGLLLYETIVIGTWFGLLYLWKQVDFRYGAEWWINKGKTALMRRFAPKVLPIKLQQPVPEIYSNAVMK
jgi:hypothetical protein